MRREKELIDRLNAGQPPSAGGEHGCIPCERGRVAGDADEPVEGRLRQLLGLGGGSGAGRVEHRAVQPLHFRGAQRTAEQVACDGFNPA